MTDAEVQDQFEVCWRGGALLPAMNVGSTLTIAVQQKARRGPSNQHIVRPGSRPTTQRERDAQIEFNKARIVRMLKNGIPLRVISASLHIPPHTCSRLANLHMDACREDRDTTNPIASGGFCGGGGPVSVLSGRVLKGASR